MKSSLVFIIAEFLFGLGISWLGLYLFESHLMSSSLNAEILSTFLYILISSIVGVSSIGFFYLRSKKMQHQFVIGLSFCVAGAITFLMAYSFSPGFVPPLVGILMPLIGAVAGFNFPFTKFRLRSLERKQ